MRQEATVDLSTFQNSAFNRGRGKLTEAVWLLVRLFFFQLNPFCFSSLKCLVLRLFGAKIGKRVVVKPGVKITFPWKLEVGDNVWIGEDCWILNLDFVKIGANVCISQRAMLCTGSHDYKSSTFDLIVKPIVIREGAWITACAWVGPGVQVGPHAVLSPSSVATKDLEPYSIYQGNPAVKIRDREISAG